MQMKAAHLVSVLILAAILLAALPSPSAIREPRDPTSPTTKILTTTTSSVLTIVTTTKIATTTSETFSAPTTTQSLVFAQATDSSLNIDPVGGFMEPVNKLALLAPWLALIGLVACISTAVVIAKKRP